MPAVATHHQIRQDVHRTVGRSRLHSHDPLAGSNQIHRLVLHPELKAGKSLGVIGKKVQKIPLRHQRDELARGRQVAKVSGLHREIAYPAAHRTQLLVRQLEKIVQQPQLVHYFQRGWMHGVAAKIAEEVGVLFQDDNFHSGTRQQVPQHYTGRPATHNAACSSH